MQPHAHVVLLMGLMAQDKLVPHFDKRKKEMTEPRVNSLEAFCINLCRQVHSSALSLVEREW